MHVTCGCATVHFGRGLAPNHRHLDGATSWSDLLISVIFDTNGGVFECMRAPSSQSYGGAVVAEGFSFGRYHLVTCL